MGEKDKGIYHEESIKKNICNLARVSGVNVRSDLAFLLLFSFVPHGLCCTPQIKLPTKSSSQHTLKVVLHEAIRNHDF